MAHRTYVAKWPYNYCKFILNQWTPENESRKFVSNVLLKCLTCWTTSCSNKGCKSGAITFFAFSISSAINWSLKSPDFESSSKIPTKWTIKYSLSNSWKLKFFWRKLLRSCQKKSTLAGIWHLQKNLIWHQLGSDYKMTQLVSCYI